MYTRVIQGMGSANERRRLSLSKPTARMVTGITNVQWNLSITTT